MADTSTANLTQELQDLIAAQMLIQVDDAYLFYGNGPVEMVGPEGTSDNDGATVVNFNRPTLPTGTYTETSRRLTDGTAISTTGIAISETQVSLTVREYAGPHDGTAVRPFSVTEFLKRRAKHDVIALIGQFMRRDRNRFLDVTIRDLLLAATTVVTPDGSAEGAVAAGAKASMQFLRNLNKTMKDAKIPTYPNGKWRLMINTQDEQDLMSDEEYREAYRYFAASNPLFTGHVNTVMGFDIMVTTNISTKAVGAGGAVTGYQGAAWGPYGIGHGIAMQPSIRKADDTDFGRSEKVLWISHEIVGTLYSDLFVRTITTQP
jgi:hypothetical protein